MTLALAAGAGFLAGRLLWLLLRPAFAVPTVQRENYRGRPVPTAAGLVLPAALVVVEAGRVVAGSADVGTAGLDLARVATLVAVPAFALFGLLDDLLGTGEHRGFSGHLAALVKGRLTTGGAKLLGGGAVALVVASLAAGGGTVGRLLVDAGVIALAANLGNLFDRAPGRAIKVGVGAGVALAGATTVSTSLTGPAVVVGAALALLLDDLHEHLMLGDTGANALGAALGTGVVVACATSTRGVVLVVLVAANLLSEVLSFSRVIDRVAPLRALDRWGRRG